MQVSLAFFLNTKHQKKTLKKTRKFIVDGVEVNVTTSKIITDNDTKNEEMRFLRYSHIFIPIHPVHRFNANIVEIHFRNIFSLTTLPRHLQAPGVEGAASPAERGAEVSTTAQQQAAAAKRPNLSAL